MASLWGLSAILLGACGGGKPQVGTTGTAGDAGAANEPTGGKTARGGNGGLGGGLGELGGTAAGGSSSTAPNPCAMAGCTLGQACVVTAGKATCVDRTCSELSCSATEECQPVTGGGNRCVSIACTTDVQCDAKRYCSGSICVTDSCDANERRCDGSRLLACASNGGGESSPYSCKSDAYFSSTCSSVGMASCSCQDDWDCPAFTMCEAGSCQGTGVAPTCTLPPARFEDVLPQSEMHWGGKSSTNRNAVDGTGAVSPFQWSNQVASTPIIANLDDDTGDGIINELDFPELLFISHRGDSDNPDADGVVRAIHGGGPSKGKDYFAVCGGVTWAEGQPVVQDCNPSDTDLTSMSSANHRPGGMVAVGDIDGDGKPEVVTVLENAGFSILDNRGTNILTATGVWPSGTATWKYPGPAIANLDHTGPAEVIVGNRVFSFTVTAGKLTLSKIYAGNQAEGVQHQVNSTNLRHNGPVVCPADLDTTRPGLEFVAGTTLYALPAAPAAGCGTSATPCALDVVWDGRAVNGAALSAAQREGFCAVADVLGADPAQAPSPTNSLDGKPEVIVVANGYLLILDGATGTLLRSQNLQDGTTSTFDCVGSSTNCVSGGSPNVDDFDGDGFPEIATAMQKFYQVVDLQAPSTACPAWPNALNQSGAPPQTNPARSPGAACTKDSDCSTGAVCNPRTLSCVCLHNGWKRTTEDDSSAVTSSSVFDFNGDGAAEVVYSDECYFRVYSGTSGGVYLQLPAVNRTLVDNPVVADVDNDGNAEIVVVQNNAALQCGSSTLSQWPTGTVARDSLPNGIEVFGDSHDTWVAARRIWNEHAYHVTNVLESGAIPAHEPESFKPWNGRLYNTYRSQPRNYGVAPDLVASGIQVFSPNVACGQLSSEVQITVGIKNQGDLRVGPGVVIAFYGIWSDSPQPVQLLDASGSPLQVTLTTSLEPGMSLLTPVVSYKVGNGGTTTLPSQIQVVVDADSGGGSGAALECKENNNSATAAVEAGQSLSDLRLVVTRATGCEPAKLDFTLYNDGALPASNVVIDFYAGDPSSGGTRLGQTTVAGPIGAGSSVTGTATVGSVYRSIVVWGVADPENVIEECNDANNVDSGPSLDCAILQ